VISGGTPKRPGSTNVPSPRCIDKRMDVRGHATASWLEVCAAGRTAGGTDPPTVGVMITRKTAHIKGLTTAPAGLFWADEVHTDRLPHRGAIMPDRAAVEGS
jgi:hypothetical protein